MLAALLRFVVLPREMTRFEEQYLTRMNRVALGFFAAHLPLFVLIAALNGTGPLTAAALTAAALVGPVVAVRACAPRTASVVMGVTAMLMGGVLVHIGQGPVQIEMHFYFFVLLALLAVFANPLVIVAAAAAAAVHHAVVWLLLPASVFNYDAPVWVVAVHAAFVVLESVAACYIARSFFDNVVGLEKIVAARTAALAARNRDMRTLLDVVDQGFFTVDARGVMSEERSAAVDRWLGAPPAGATLPDFLRPLAPAFADWLALGLDDVFADLMPVELTVAQLPGRLVLGDRTLRFEYVPVPRGGPPAGLAVTISDVSAQVARERLEAEHRVMMAMAERIGQDRAGFLEFVAEAEALVAALPGAPTDDLTVVKRTVHTLKGNAAIFGLELVAEACHAIEDHIAEHGALPGAAAWEALAARWQAVRANLRRLVGEAAPGITLADAEYADVLAGILSDESRDALAWRVAAWRLEPTGARLARIGEQARTLARRYGKGDIDVRVRGGALRIDPDRWGFFWSAFVHVVRNAIDHGLEAPDDRSAAGKAPVGALELTTEVCRDRFVVSVRDDGRGIDWDRIAALARARNAPADTRQQLVDALFLDGLSTAEAVTDLSGRGVGMAAVRTACAELDGRVEVDSERGRGTTVRFSFPLAAMAPATVALLGRHGIATPERVFLGDWRRPAPEAAGRPDEVPQSTAL